MKEGRQDEVDFMVHKLDMFDFGSWEEAMLFLVCNPTSGSHAPQ